MKKKLAKNRNISELQEVKHDFIFDSLIETFFRNKKNGNELQVITDRTCVDLDLDDLFCFVDRTNSKVGQQFIYDRLRRIPEESYYTEPKQKIINKILKDKEFRGRIVQALSKLDNHNSYYIPTLFQEKCPTVPKWFFTIKYLAIATVLLICLSFIFPVLIFVLAPIAFINILIHFWNKNNISKYRNSLPQLVTLCNVAETLSKESILDSVNPNIKDSISVISRLKTQIRFFIINNESHNEIAQAIIVTIELVVELIKMTLLIEPLLLLNITKKLDRSKVNIESLFNYVGEIDTLYSVASLQGTNKHICEPKIIQSSSIIVKKLRHPLMINCIENDVMLKDKSMLLTGSNMSGKTTFIRAIGINTLTAFTLNTCFAESFELPKMSLSTVIRISDDLMGGKSYYFEEVEAMKEVLESSKSEQRSIIILDEIFKGTNTIERVSVAKAVLSYLAKHNNIVFASTHDMELVDMLNQEYTLCHFSEQVNKNEISFDYKLKTGCSTTRNAIKILEINGYPTKIVNEANEIAKTISRKALVV